MRPLILLVAAAVLLVVPGAFAQTAYVGASVFGDIVRSGGTQSPVSDAPGNGEAIGFTVRAGTPLGAQWGIEAEFARPAEIENEMSNDIRPLITLPVPVPPGVSLPPSFFSSFRYRTTYRNTTFSTAAWVRQDFTARSSLVYLGGLGFYRSESDFGYSFDPRALLGVPTTGLSILPYDTETIIYGVRPFVGMEARLGLGEHVQVVPGIRLHGVDDGWLVRPAVGLNWMF